MDKQDKKPRNFRLLLLDAASHQRLWSFRFSRTALIVSGISALVVLLVGLFCLVAFTPIRTFIPGYPDAKSRRQAVQNALRIDSLETRILQWELYTENLRRVVAGEDPLRMDSLILGSRGSRDRPDSAYLALRDSLLRADVSRQEQFQLSGTQRKLPIEAMSFYAPVKGVVSRGFDRALHPYVDVTAPAGTQVMSVLDGTIVSTSWEEESGYSLTIQHDGDILSIYSHTQKLLHKRGDKVKAGQVIAEPGGFISAFVHSPVSGTVKAIGPMADLAGKPVTHITIDVEGDEWAEGIDLSDTLVTEIPQDRQAILDRIRLNGVVGLGGATFPAHVKLNPAPGSPKAEALLINGAECEPFLTSDYRIMLERTKEIVVGAAIMQKVLGDCKCHLCIEDNKPEAIAAMSKAVIDLGFDNMVVTPLKKKYPQGGEKQLIDAVMHRQVGSGALPISVGAVVQNVATALAVYEAVQKNRPLLTNTLTVTGDCLPVGKQHNYLFRIGVPLSYIAEYAGGVPEGAAKIVSGGPMMGKAVANLDATTVKGSSSLLYLSYDTTKRGTESACIRCGRCADACPMGLEPFLLNRLQKAGDVEALEKNAAQDCIECGCCLYSCPAYIPLLDNVRLAKQAAMGAIRARAAAAKAAAEAAKAAAAQPAKN